MGQDSLRPKGRRPEDVDHLLEVAQLPLEVLDVLLEHCALPFGELKAQVEQRRKGLADSEPLAARVGADPLLQTLVEPDSYPVSLRFHSFLHSLSQPQSLRPGAAEHPQRFPDWLRHQAGCETKRHASRGSLRIARERVQPQARPDEPIEPTASQSGKATSPLRLQEEDADWPQVTTRPCLRR